MKLISKILGKTKGNTSKSISDITALQKSISKSLSDNIADLQKFTSEEIPKTITVQNDAMMGLEQLSNYVKGMIK